MKIRPVGAELFFADGRTDMISLIAALRSFATRLKNVTCRNSVTFTSAGDVLIPGFFSVCVYDWLFSLVCQLFLTPSRVSYVTFGSKMLGVI
jgi:hypothetical protein